MFPNRIAIIPWGQSSENKDVRPLLSVFVRGPDLKNINRAVCPCYSVCKKAI